MTASSSSSADKRQWSQHRPARSFDKGLNIQRLYRAINTILLIGFFFYTLNSWFNAREQIESELKHINGLFSQSIDSVFRHHESVLKILGLRFLDIGAQTHPERGRQLVDGLMRVNPAMAGFGLAQPNGQLILVSGVPAGKPLPNLLAQTESTATFLQVFDTDRLVIGRTYFLPLLDAWLIPIRIAVRNEDEHLKLVMTAGLLIDSNEAMWNAIKLPEKMQITLVRKDGFVQLRLPTTDSDKQQIYGDPVPDSWVFSAHAPLGADPFRGGGLAVSSELLDGSMRSFASYPSEYLWSLFARQLLLPMVLFSSAFIFASILFHNVSRNQRHYEAHLLHQAHYDDLTTLPNRLLAFDRLEQVLKEAQRDENKVAVLFLDLDDFKRINDCLGHNVGDDILIETAQRLHRAVRGSDTVARLGGDEFIVILGGLASLSDIQPIAEKLLNQFNEPFHCEHRELVLSASIGVSVYPADGEAPVELLRKADTAMYHSKSQGRSVYQFFTNEMNLRANRHLLLEEQLRGALEKGELALEYQPVMDIRNGRMAGAEALLRWRNAKLGSVSPAEFIPIAEQSGLIVPIGRFVLQTALEQLSIWHDRFDSDLQISINLSPRQFRDPLLLEFIRSTLSQQRIARGRLELEITEGVLISKHVNVTGIIDTLKEMGISIAMDDFGTGYSSLSYLRNYPFDTLKIDRSFVSGISHDSKHRELVNAIISTAQSLGLKVVAEGVESEVELEYLCARGCDYAQGYFFSKPLPVMDIEPWMESVHTTTRCSLGGISSL